ncbi:MAG: autotransporter outer membrane beta-barrel domain-containing protein [Verrucomicrobia bacterium]|nr:autotransporter outer membrane beta-barrel domain-containing protein [Verrucomicrobiota bacterium]
MLDLQAALEGHLNTLALGVLSDSEPSLGEAKESAAWTTIYGGWVARDGSSSLGRSGFSSNNYGNISGVEHRFGDLTLGLTGAVGSTSANFKESGASLSTDTWHAGLYGSMPLELEELGLVFDAGFVFGQGEAKMKRSLSSVGAGNSTGNVSSSEWMGQIGISIPSLLPDDTTTITPSLHLIYGSYSQKAVNEGSLTGLEAKVGAYSQASAASRLGLQAAKLMRVGRLPARLTASMNWLHSFDSGGRNVDIAFSSAGSKTGQFSGTKTGMDAIRLGLGSELAITDRTRFLLTIDHQIQKGQSSTTGNASVGVQF